LTIILKATFSTISLGDSEELWENTLNQVKKNNTITFEAEKRFILKDKFFKVFGNHDLYWDNSPIASQQLKAIYGKKLRVFEGIILEKDNKEEHVQEKKVSTFSFLNKKSNTDPASFANGCLPFDNFSHSRSPGRCKQ
jgi:hypothetical protein